MPCSHGLLKGKITPALQHAVCLRTATYPPPSLFLRTVHRTGFSSGNPHPTIQEVQQGPVSLGPAGPEATACVGQEE